MKIYLDLPLLGALLSWIQDSVLLWMVAQITTANAPWKRLIAGGAVGGLFQLLIMVNQAAGRAVFPWVGSPLIFSLVIPLLMIGIAFFPLKLKRTLMVLGYFYLLAFLLSGIHWGLDSINRRYFRVQINFWWHYWLHLACIFILGELGWGVVHRKLWDQLCLYPIQIIWDGNKLTLNALLDTGNRLHDPLTKVPVVIIEFTHIKQLLPSEVVDLIENLQHGDLDPGMSLPAVWQERFRVLPFKTIGREHGILIGFRPDSLKIWQKQQEIINNRVVVGLYNRQLSPEGAFQALIPPAVLSCD